MNTPFGEPTVAPTPTPNGAAIQILQPITGATIQGSRILVRGRVLDTQVEKGVTVNDTVAFVHEGQFAAVVAANATGGELVARLYGSEGAIAEDTVAIQVSSSQSSFDELTLTSTDALGVAPHQVSLHAVYLGPTATYAWDLDGDGSEDQSGPHLTDVSGTYSSPGLYFPTVRILDLAGNEYRASTVVYALDRDPLVALLDAKWQAMKDLLRSGDVPAALQYVANAHRIRYQAIVESLTVPLSGIDQVLTTLEFVGVRSGVAEHRMPRPDSRGDIHYGIRFSLDRDGIWRLSSM